MSAKINQKTLSKFGQSYINYGCYHNNPVNQWIHIIFVPVITMTLLMMLSYLPIKFPISGYEFGLQSIAILLVVVHYLRINVIFGIVFVVFTILTSLFWLKLISILDKSSLFLPIVVIHIVSWIFQFVGHGVFQKRKPALLDNLSQILNAPLFVGMEVIEKLGYTNSQLQEWKKIIDKKVALLKNKYDNLQKVS